MVGNSTTDFEPFICISSFLSTANIMSHVRRERFNSMARQSIAGESHKKKGKGKSRSSTHAESLPTDQDPNVDILVPKTKEEKELDRKEKMRLEVCL